MIETQRGNSDLLILLVQKDEHPSSIARIKLLKCPTSRCAHHRKLTTSAPHLQTEPRILTPGLKLKMKVVIPYEMVIKVFRLGVF